MKIVKIDINNIISTIDLDFDINIKKSLKNIDNNNLDLLYKWNIESNIIECYGCLDSSINILNQHILPSVGIPSSNIICDKSEECNIYGYIYIVCKKNDNYIDYYDYDYGTLYFNINDIANYCNNDDDNDNDDNDDDNDDDNNNNINDISYNDDNDKLLKSQYLIKKSKNDLLDYDNNIY